VAPAPDVGGNDPELAVLAVDTAMDVGGVVIGGRGPDSHTRDGDDDCKGDGGAMNHAASWLFPSTAAAAPGPPRSDFLLGVSDGAAPRWSGQKRLRPASRPVDQELPLDRQVARCGVGSDRARAAPRPLQ
jgi:hypothetical protein